MNNTACNHDHHFTDARRRQDPTGTTTLRRRFENDLARRFRRLKGLINEAIVKGDVLGIGKFQNPNDEIVKIVKDEAPQPGAFAFNTSQDKVAAFMRWLKQQEREGILEIQEGVSLENAAQSAWTTAYIQNAYQKGIKDAGRKLRRGGASVAPTWIENAFTRPIHADRVGLAYTRTFTQLQGITEAMDQQISRVLASGLANGDNPMKIARDMANRVDKVGITRARVLARTEVINAHAEATLNGFAEAGIEGVEVEAEFSTAGDSRVCPECEDLEGNVYTIREGRGKIPVHPNAILEGSTFVPYGKLKELVRSWFKGPAVKISSFGGHTLTIGPNHPVLTNRGWVRAALLNKGDKLVHDRRHPLPNIISKSNFEQIPFVEDFFASNLGISTTANASASGLDFHGDGIFCKGKIDIVDAANGLLFEGNTVLSEHPGEPFLMRPDATLFKVTGCGSPLSRSDIFNLAASSTLSFGSTLFSFFRRCLLSLKRVALGYCSIDTGFCEQSPKMATGTTDLSGDSIGGHTRFVKPNSFFDVNRKSRLLTGSSTKSSFDSLARLNVETDAARFTLDMYRHYEYLSIESVKFIDFEGWAFDASTETGAFATNGVYTKNCRCAFLPVVKNGTGMELR